MFVSTYIINSIKCNSLFFNIVLYFLRTALEFEVVHLLVVEIFLGTYLPFYLSITFMYFSYLRARTGFHTSRDNSLNASPVYLHHIVAQLCPSRSCAAANTCTAGQNLSTCQWHHFPLFTQILQCRAGVRHLLYANKDQEAFI